MNRVTVTVELDTGETLECTLRPATAVAAERHFKGTPPAIEGTLWAVWHQLRIDTPFGAWLETIAGVEEQLVPPTSATSSAPSPSSP